MSCQCEAALAEVLVWPCGDFGGKERAARREPVKDSGLGVSISPEKYVGRRSFHFTICRAEYFRRANSRRSVECAVSKAIGLLALAGLGVSLIAGEVARGDWPNLNPTRWG